MGGCVFRPENCVDGKVAGGSRRTRNRNKRRNRKRAHSHLSDPSSDGRTDKLSPLSEDRAFNSPTIHGPV
ncbi:hypothetical protein CASFOL_009381 [Castilleja foliolosa]|uniref:Uncharacterized protein n=1 Tax=Castilleja foliolosa TaxID=1961234 RepID=A0ABD3DZ53_9LAMI